jgi:hypothetical protein
LSPRSTGTAQRSSREGEWTADEHILARSWPRSNGIVDHLFAACVAAFLRTLFSCKPSVKFLPLKNILDLRTPVSVDVSMNTTRPLRMVLPATRKGLAGNAMSPGQLGDKLETCEQIKDLAAMRHYEGWQQDCTTMLDLL